MKKFHFRLETLLRFRKIQESQAQIKLAEATNRLQRAQELLATLNTQLLINLDLFAHQQTASPTVDELKTFSYYIDKIKRDIAAQAGLVAKLANYRLECLKTLEEAATARKVVDNLREQRLEEYHNEFLQEEQKSLDEIGAQVFMRDKESDMK